MKSSEYWRRRFEALEDAQTRKGAEYFSQLEKQYQKASAAVQKEVNAWYARFAVNNEISLVEAKKLLNAGELKELKWNVMEYIEKGKTLNISDAWAKELENASARWHISRLEALQLQMQNQVEMLYGTEHDEISKLMEKIYTEGYYHTAYEIQSGFNIGYDLMKLDTNRIGKVLSKPWAADGANFSSRIWKQKTQLVKDLHTELTQAIIRGKNPHQVTQAIAKRFDVSMGQAGRLVSTEAAFFASAANRDCYKDLDVERYEILATLDNRTSDVCQGLDGKVFKMSEYEVGVTAPPFHVWCRTTTVPFFDDEFELGAKRAARGEDGRTYYVPADMKYPEWKKTFVDGGSKDNLQLLNVIDGAESGRVREGAQMMDEGTDQEKAKITTDFTPANSIEEAQEAAKQYIGSGYSKTFKNEADYKGISLDNANEINRALDELYAKYDMPKINGIKAISPTSAQGKKVFSDVDAVAAYSPVEHGIFLNKDVLKNARAIEEYNKQATEAWDIVMQNVDKLSGSQKETALLYKNAGRALVGDGTVHDYIVHEMGHHVQWEVLDSATNNAMGKNMSKYAPGISGYANASKGEYIAESFAAYTKGEIEKLDPVFVDYMKNGIVKNSNGDIMEASVEYVKKNTSVLPTVQLPKKEYAHVMSEINTHMNDEQRKLPIVSKAIGDYIYTFENHGFNEYRIIGKVPIESEKYDEIERIFDEIE